MTTYRPDGEKIKSLRKAKNLSQEAVAALSEDLPRPYGSVSDRTLRTAERGTARINEEQLKAIAAVLETTLENIIIPDKAVEPFLGLKAYSQEHSSLFGGRDNFCSRAVSMLETHNVSLIVGPSGSGKSSLCYAGIAPEISKSDKRAVFISFKPGTHALDALSRAFCTELSPSDSPTETARMLGEFREMLKNNDRGLTDLITASLLRDNIQTIIIYIDQGEELYTQAEDTKELFSQLGIALDTLSPDFKLVISARSDYLGELTHLDGTFFSRFDHATLVLRRMSDEELLHALLQPLEELQISFDRQLIDALIADARDQEGYLPHIQFVLNTLWKSDIDENTRLTLERYFEAGRLSGAIARHASNVYDKLSPEEKIIAKAALPRLVMSRPHGQDVAARKPLNSFTEDAQKLLKRLVGSDARILSIDENGIVSFAHEEVIRQWDELSTWLRQQADDSRIRDSLEHDIEAWIQQDRSTGYLVPNGKKLRSYEDLIKRLSHDACPAHATEFLKRSKVKHNFLKRSVTYAVASTAAVGLVIISTLLFYDVMQESFQKWKQDAAIAEINKIPRKKNKEYIKSEKLFFPYGTDKRVATDKEVAVYFVKHYNYKEEKNKIGKLLSTCVSLDRISWDHVSAIQTNFASYSAKCNRIGISRFSANFSLLTESHLPKDFSIVRGKFVGSFLNKIDFKNTDLHGTYFLCSDISGSDLSRVRQLSKDQIEQAFCFYPNLGPPKLPKGQPQPPGCQWIDNLKKKYSWENYTLTHSDQEKADINLNRKKILKKYYYQCITKEKSFALAELALRKAVQGKLDEAVARAKQLIATSNHQYIKLRTAPIFILAGEITQGRQYYENVKNGNSARWGDFKSIAITDINNLLNAGHKSKELLRIRQSLN